MITKRTQKILIIVLAFVAAMFLSVAGISYAVNGTTPLQTNVALSSEYMVGDIVNIPEKTLSDGSDNSVADVTVYFPSGAAMRATSVELTESGLYTVEYRAVLNGKIVKENAYFNAYDELYSFSGDKSSANYGLDTSKYDTGRTALNIALAQGETITFNKIIDLNDVKDNMFVTFYGTPEKPGTAEVNGIYFTLTDIYDPSNTITFQYKLVPYLGASYVYQADYVCAGHTDQKPRAYTYDASSNVWRLRVNDKFGTGTALSLYGWAELYGGTAIKDSYCQFGIDLETKKAYVNDNKKTSPAEIIDMDNPAQFEKLWEGFTTGEVYLSIKGYDYSGGYLHLNIMDVAGYDFSVNAVKDTEKPLIAIDNKDYDLDNLPNGYAGYSYPVFTASAFDKGDGYVDVDVKAYYNYDSDSTIELSIENGVVETDRVGKYKYVYTAKDKFGNVAVEEVIFFVQADKNAMTINLIGEYGTSVKVGETVAIADYNVVGGSGTTNVEITFDKKCTFDKNTKTLLALEEGALTVTYTAIDVTGATEVKTYVINVQENPVPVMLEDVYVPDYLFGGVKYQFPAVSGHDFNTEEDVAAKVFVDGVEITNGLYTPENKQGLLDGVSNNGVLADPYTVKVEYKIGNDVLYSKSITVIDITYRSGPMNKISIDRYFIGNGLTVSADSTGIKLHNDSVSSSTAKVQFAKAILYNAASVGIQLNRIDAQAFTVVLTDVYDSSNVLRAGFVKDVASGKTYFTVNGTQTVYSLSKGGFFDLSTPVNVSFQNGVISDGNTISYDVSKIFNAEKVNIEVEFSGLAVGSELDAYILQVSDINMNSSVTSDLIAPFAINLSDAYPLHVSKGDAIDILPIVTEDLLSTYIDVKVTVKITNSTDEYVLLKDADATKAYRLTLNQYGTCSIEYTLTDTANQSRKPKYEVEVVNYTEPVITINGSVPTVIKLAQTYVFPSAVATDDIDGEIEVYYFVVNSALNPVMLVNRSFTPNSTGRHVFRVYAIDSSGNIALKDIEFEVVK